MYLNTSSESLKGCMCILLRTRLPKQICAFATAYVVFFIVESGSKIKYK